MMDEFIMALAVLAVAGFFLWAGWREQELVKDYNEALRRFNDSLDDDETP